MTHEKYTEKVFEVFEQSDYSKFPDLQDLTKGEIYAISRLMHDYNTEVTVDNVLRAASHRYALYGDESALANGEFRDFIDAADAMGFASGFMEELVRRTATRARAKLVREGFHFIELTNPAKYAAFYVFHKGALGE